jgi:hypothetical protein
VQLTPACVTVTVCPPMVTVPVRDEAAVLAATVSVIVASPVPLAAESVIQAAPLDAVQLQPAVAVSPMLDVPPPAAAETVAGETE